MRWGRCSRATLWPFVARRKHNPKDPLVCSNKKALVRYTVVERLEAGIELTGSEVKSLRARQANLEGGYAAFERGQLFLHNMNISSYEQANAFGHAMKRPRKLLVHKKQLLSLEGKVSVKGLTLIPLKVYFKDGWAKVELGLARSKDTQDRREDLKAKADLRDMKQAMQTKRSRGGRT